MAEADIIVIGAGASGLTVAACLQRLGREPIVLDGDERIGGTWTRRYDRLCLHTTRRFSRLPYLPMPASYPRYVPKDLFAAYLEDYAAQLRPDARLGEQVERIERRADGRWLIAASDEWTSATVVIATGKHREPRIPAWPGMERFNGPLLHAAEYRNGNQWAGRRALVIGIGNSGAEIAVDLVESGAAHVSISIRHAPPISTREIFGIPVQLLGMALAPFPPRIVDAVGSKLRRLGTGDLSTYGIASETWGPFTARRPPVIDAGFVKHLKAGRICVVPLVDRFTEDGVRFVDGTEDSSDVVVAATGFTTRLANLIAEPNSLDERDLPGAGRRAEGLFFAGFAESPRGHLYELSREASHLARAIDHFVGREP